MDFCRRSSLSQRHYLFFFFLWMFRCHNTEISKAFDGKIITTIWTTYLDDKSKKTQIGFYIDFLTFVFGSSSNRQSIPNRYRNLPKIDHYDQRHLRQTFNDSLATVCHSQICDKNWMIEFIRERLNRDCNLLYILFVIIFFLFVPHT